MTKREATKRYEVRNDLTSQGVVYRIWDKQEARYVGQACRTIEQVRTFLLAQITR